MTGLALTGATGFVGRRVAGLLAANELADVRLIVRDPAKLAPGTPPAWRVVAADLTEPDRYRAALAGTGTVIHLAARTGRGTASEHRAANTDATAQLLAAARSAGTVRRFLFVSSIAAGYSDRRHYHYAEAKAAAERLVLESPLETLIIRPTMVFGPGSPALANLISMATLPWPAMFGPGQSIQPVHVDDLARAIVAALEVPDWGNRIVAYGGPEVTTMDGLFERIRATRGRPLRRPLHLPLEPLRSILAMLEPVAARVLPFSAGQLAAFANSSVATRSAASDLLPNPTIGLDPMVAPS